MQRGASQGLLVGFAARKSPKPRIFHWRSLSQRRLVRFAAQNIARTTHFMQRGASQGLLVGFAEGIIKRTALFMQRGVSGGAFICFATGWVWLTRHMGAMLDEYLEASGRKSASFMMDGVDFGEFWVVSGTVRHILGDFVDGRCMELMILY